MLMLVSRKFAWKWGGLILCFDGTILIMVPHWIHRFAETITLYISTKGNLIAYLNYIDLDISMNSHSKNNDDDGKVYGIKYFHKNFVRLVKVKTAIDPEYFFLNEQSMPTLAISCKQTIANGEPN